MGRLSCHRGSSSLPITKEKPVSTSPFPQSQATLVHCDSHRGPKWNTHGCASKIRRIARPKLQQKPLRLAEPQVGTVSTTEDPGHPYLDPLSPGHLTSCCPIPGLPPILKPVLSRF